MRHCPYLPKCRHGPTVISSTQAHSPNMYSTCILAFQIDRNSASCTELNNLKQIRSGTITSDTGSMQRVGGPVAHYACRLPTDTTGVMAELVRRACPLDNQGNDSEAHVAPGRQGGHLPLFAKVQACSSRAQVSIGQVSGIHM